MTVSHPMFYLDNDEVIISNAEVTMVEQGACGIKWPFKNCCLKINSKILILYLVLAKREEWHTSETQTQHVRGKFRSEC